MGIIVSFCGTGLKKTHPLVLARFSGSRGEHFTDMQVNENKRLFDEQGEKQAPTTSSGDVDRYAGSNAGTDGGRGIGLGSCLSRPYYSINRGG